MRKQLIVIAPFLFILFGMFSGCSNSTANSNSIDISDSRIFITEVEIVYVSDSLGYHPLEEFAEDFQITLVRGSRNFGTIMLHVDPYDIVYENNKEELIDINIDEDIANCIIYDIRGAKGKAVIELNVNAIALGETNLVINFANSDLDPLDIAVSVVDD